MTTPSHTSLVAYFFFFVSFCMVLGAIYSVATIDVLKNWTLTLPSGDIHAGDTIVVNSSYTKLRNVGGTATRYIDCDTSSGSRLAYLLNQKEANRGAGVSTGTAIEITLPTNISDLPTTCDIRIVIKYRVVPFKDTTEINQTRDFQLLPILGGGSVSVAPLATQTSRAQTLGVSPSPTLHISSSSSKNTLNPQPAQSNNVQDTTSPSSSPSTTNTSNNTTTNNPAPEQTCSVSVLGLGLLCRQGGL